MAAKEGIKDWYMQDFFTVILVQQKNVSVLHSMRFRNEFQGEASTERDPII